MNCRRECGDALPCALPSLQHEGDDVDVRVQCDLAAKQVVQHTALSPAVAHLRECAQRPDADPVAGTLVAEELAPATGTNGNPRSPTVGHRASARDDIYAVGASERSCPAADHVVVAAKSAVLQCLRRRSVQAWHVRAHLAVARQAEEREPDVAWRNPCLRTNGQYCLAEYLADQFDAA